MTATDPVSVEIVRPEQTPALHVSRAVIRAALLLVRALVVMVIAGHFDLAWSYWDALLAAVGISWLLPSRDLDLTTWTRAAEAER